MQSNVVYTVLASRQSTYFRSFRAKRNNNQKYVCVLGLREPRYIVNRRENRSSLKNAVIYNLLQLWQAMFHPGARRFLFNPLGFNCMFTVITGSCFILFRRMLTIITPQINSTSHHFGDCRREGTSNTRKRLGDIKRGLENQHETVLHLPAPPSAFMRNR